jgi:hypothetical protein
MRCNIYIYIYIYIQTRTVASLSDSAQVHMCLSCLASHAVNPEVHEMFTQPALFFQVPPQQTPGAAAQVSSGGADESVVTPRGAASEVNHSIHAYMCILVKSIIIQGCAWHIVDLCFQFQPDSDRDMLVTIM